MPSYARSSSEYGVYGLFRREGDYWTIAYAGQIVHLRDTKGLHYLAHLLRHPGQDFAVVELRSVGPEPRPDEARRRGTPTAPVSAEVERTRKAVTNRIRQSVARIATAHAALGGHLTNAVHTGTRCVYTPERFIRWSA
jgi:hypothetical protein